MSVHEVVTNAGNLFSDNALASIEDSFDVSEDQLRDWYDQIREHTERRRANLTDELDAGGVGFYFLARVLHILGYTHSHGEPLPNGVGTTEYTLFDNAEDFLANGHARGNAQMFSVAHAIGKAQPWASPLSEIGEDATPENPAFEFDDLLRQTGVQWAFISNGRQWRLYHRNTAGMLSAYYEVDLFEIIETADFEAFKFFLPFTKEGIVHGASRQLLA